LNSGVQVTKISLENKTYLLHLVLEFTYEKMTWTKLMRIQLLKSKYKKYMLFESSSIWHGIKDA